MFILVAIKSEYIISKTVFGLFFLITKIEGRSVKMKPIRSSTDD